MFGLSDLILGGFPFFSWRPNDGEIWRICIQFLFRVWLIHSWFGFEFRVGWLKIENLCWPLILFVFDFTKEGFFL